MNSLNDAPKVEAITVVLLEDDAPTLWRLQDALTKAGYQVRAAGTLAEARACLAQGAPRVLLTDLQLPDGHGVDLIRETRRRFPDTEIMVISILGDEESVISAITVVVEGAPEKGPEELDGPELVRRVRVREEAGERRKEAIAAVAAEAGLPKREVFDAVVAAKNAAS